MLSFRIAARFLRKSPVQSILIAAGIAVGIGVQVFLGSLITSLQTSLVDQTIGNSPQVVVQRRAGRAAGRLHAAAQAGDGGPERDHHRRADARRTRPSSARARRARRSSSPAARSTSSTPSTTSPAGWSPARRRWTAGQVLVGKDFADTYGLKPGDAASFVLPSGKPAELTVSGVFDFGSAAANSATAFVNGDEAATVLGLAADEYSAVDAQVRRRVLVRAGRRRPAARSRRWTASR